MTTIETPITSSAGTPELFLNPYALRLGERAKPTTRRERADYDGYVTQRSLEQLISSFGNSAGFTEWEVDELLELPATVSLDIGGITFVPVHDFERVVFERLGFHIQVMTVLKTFDTVVEDYRSGAEVGE